MITIPTLQELYTAILTDLQTQYGVSINPIGKTFLRALAAVQAAKLKLYYLVIGNLQKNIAPDTADPEAIGGTLERFGRIKLGRNPFPAQAAQYEIEVTGIIGGVIDAQTTWKSNDDSLNPGILYILDNSFILVTTPDTIIVRCLTAGLSGQLDISDQLTATQPIALVNALATVVAVTVEPLAAEDIEAYRTAVLNSYRLEAQGGAATDYRLWSQDAQGVAKVYPYAKSGATSEVDLYVEAIAASSTDGKGTPSFLLLQSVEDVIEFSPDTTLPINERGRRPLTVIVNYLPITPLDVDIDIVGYIGATPGIETLILNALTAYTNKIRPFIAGADILSEKNDLIDINNIASQIIGAQPGSVFDSVTLTINGITYSSFRFLLGQIPFLNSVTYS